MASLQKPRKIVVLGDDGNPYSFLCKPKDDLRKDARLMEFNSIINKLLKKNSESRKRKLCKEMLAYGSALGLLTTRCTQTSEPML
jgi:phosphatidylinositol kinase/protein kinase (PI-3  family)